MNDDHDDDVHSYDDDPDDDDDVDKCFDAMDAKVMQF